MGFSPSSYGYLVSTFPLHFIKKAFLEPAEEIMDVAELQSTVFIVAV